MEAATGNVRTARFRYLLGGLPPRIRSAAEMAFATFERDSFHPALDRHDLIEVSRGRHVPGTFAVSVTKKYRALAFTQAGRNVWYWIGSHNDYENFIGKK